MHPMASQAFCMHPGCFVCMWGPCPAAASRSSERYVTALTASMCLQPATNISTLHCRYLGRAMGARRSSRLTSVWRMVCRCRSAQVCTPAPRCRHEHHRTHAASAQIASHRGIEQLSQHGHPCSHLHRVASAQHSLFEGPTWQLQAADHATTSAVHTGISLESSEMRSAWSSVPNTCRMRVSLCSTGHEAARREAALPASGPRHHRR